MEIFTYPAVSPGKSVHYPPAPVMKRVIMRMQIIIFILAFGFVHATGNVSAQQVTLTAKDEKLAEVFQKLREQTGYRFNYHHNDVDQYKVTFSIESKNIREALDKCLEGLPLTYTLTGKIIVIREKSIGDAPKPQPHFVTGIVTDVENKPLVGVTVRIKGTNVGTTTDDNGFYRVQADPNGVIEFSMVGYHLISIKINGQISIDMMMVASMTALTETVVKGYYTTTKELNTGNVSTVTAEQISHQPVGDPMAALVSRVPGLNVQQTSGVNGRRFIVRLRGQNSIDNGNDPLYIVDGVQYNSSPLNSNTTSQFTVGGLASPFNYLNPADIESIDVLKDADATAIYGSRGANGVILITTKKAKDGKLELDARYYTGFSQAPIRMKLMNTTEYLTMRRQAFINDNRTPGPADHDLNGNWDTTRYTDWQKYFIGGTAHTNDVSISTTMGSNTTAFRIGANYRSEGTIFPGDFNSKRAGVNFSATHSALQNRFNMNFSGSYGYSENNLPVGTAEQFITLAPNAPEIYNPDGSLNWANSTWGNPMAFYERTAFETAKTLISNLSVSYSIWKKLTFKTSFGFTSTNFKQRNLTPWSAFDPSFATIIQPSMVRLHQIIYNDIRTFVVEPQLSYSQTVFGGEMDILVGGTLQGSSADQLGIMATGYPSDVIMKNFSAGTSFNNVTRTSSEYKYSSLFARLGYNFDHRYVINLTGRRDASSRFGPGKRAGSFGAIGAGWIFSNEEFFKGASKIVSFGKLRFSYGTTGNDQLGEYKYLNTYSILNLPYQGNSSLVPTQLTNPFYGWEHVNKIEAGLELGFLNGDVNLQASVYRNRTKNQLVQVPLPVSTGFESVRANLPAVIQNSGFELEIRSTNIDHPKFIWSSSINLTIPRNKLVSFPGLSTSSYSRRVVEGQPINTLYFAYEYTGLDPNTGLYTFNDINKDGAYTTSQDQIPTHFGQKFFGGLNNNIQIGKVEIDFQLSFTKQNGYGFISNGVRGTFNAGRGNQALNNNGVDLQPITQSNSAVFRQNSMFNNSDGIIVDASYIRMRNAGIYYSLPISPTIIKRSKVYIQGQNLFTISSYRGTDPESPGTSITVAPLRTIAAGIQLTL